MDATRLKPLLEDTFAKRDVSICGKEGMIQLCFTMYRLFQEWEINGNTYESCIRVLQKNRTNRRYRHKDTDIHDRHIDTQIHRYINIDIDRLTLRNWLTQSGEW